MYFKQFEEAGNKVGKPVVQIPPQAYIPIPMGIEKMATLIVDNIQSIMESEEKVVGGEVSVQ